ncbi:hypothetical protein EMIHUDRAFT_238878 [Emiliania huxleyi CCMP1516]|uniref:Uncharacterized protein n=2 Tax=Emiliania huxleyi TaxID=2903 RepID=A0A0D3JKX1_EMIH1|nr:hypothetical protein EMIHUDRAFT_238878 [Emiliania huxleyi CCMP1516]EOD24156.1 hypothetical protein EMIHUDRAFT_238878 [Emiliania huxleyi CCMP1516]|eukprot:XP_005776585.1 hypothetical protein EMIHUDRAFT_238878 [Emiliania huxleyi CCMP1516]
MVCVAVGTLSTGRRATPELRVSSTAGAVSPACGGLPPEVPLRATIVPVRRRRESEGRDRQVDVPGDVAGEPAEEEESTSGASGEAAGLSTSSRYSVSSLWDWATTRNDGSDSEQSTGSRSSSRAAALWNWRNGAASPPPSEPGSRQSSVHGGSQFEGSQKGGAGLWFWRNGHSREASAHGANAYHAAIAAARGGALPPGGPLHSPEEGSQSPRKDGSLASVGSSTSLWSWANGGSTPDSDAEHSVSGGGGWNWANGRSFHSTGMHGSVSLSRDSSISGGIWSWAKGRQSPAQSRDPSASCHSVSGPKSPGAVPPSPGAVMPPSPGAVMPPSPGAVNYSSSHGGMPKSTSNTKLWSWGQGRPTPPASRDSSVKGGSHFGKLSMDGSSHGSGDIVHAGRLSMDGSNLGESRAISGSPWTEAATG